MSTLEVVVHDAHAALPDGLGELTRECTVADRHGPFGEHTLLTLDGRRQVDHARVGCSADGALVGFAVLTEGLDAWYVELAVSPRQRGAGVGTALLAAAHDHVASHGGGRLRGWAHHAGPAAGRLLRRWTVERSLQVLEHTAPVPLPPAVPAGLTARSLDTTSGDDRDAWLALSNAAFAGHPENGGWTRADLDWRMDAVWTSSDRFPVLEDAAGLVAGVWTKVDDGEGELYVVAVHPRHQGRGLGAVVVAQALHALRHGGARRTVLYVDADNVAATALYRRAGFVLHHEDRCFGVHVAPDAHRSGPDPHPAEENAR